LLLSVILNKINNESEIAEDYRYTWKGLCVEEDSNGLTPAGVLQIGRIIRCYLGARRWDEASRVCLWAQKKGPQDQIAALQPLFDQLHEVRSSHFPIEKSPSVPRTQHATVLVGSCLSPPLPIGEGYVDRQDPMHRLERLRPPPMEDLLIKRPENGF